MTGQELGQRIRHERLKSGAQGPAGTSIAVLENGDASLVPGAAAGIAAPSPTKRDAAQQRAQTKILQRRRVLAVLLAASRADLPEEPLVESGTERGAQEVE